VSDRRVRTADGVTLALYRMRAYRDGRPAILLVHGAFANHRLWLRRRAAYFFLDRGCDVWLADLRGHGASDREPRPRAWRFDDLILQDAPALLERLRDESDARRVAWLGHSSGGAVGVCVAARTPRGAQLDAVVTLGTPGPAPLRGARRWGAATMAAIARAWGRFPARLLGFGTEDEPAHVLGDWLDWHVRGHWIGRDGYDYWAALAGMDTPFLGIAGAADTRFAPPAACVALVEHAGSPWKAFQVHPHLTHKGLALSRRARATAWTAAAEWIEDVFST
jgi:oxygen-independent coproporphyrinogen-3 oxidase